MTGSALFVAVFLACAVEAVEALTIILAAGTAREWRSALTGVGAGLVMVPIVTLSGGAGTVVPSGCGGRTPLVSAMRTSGRWWS